MKVNKKLKAKKTKSLPSLTKIKKTLSLFRTMIRSRHGTHRAARALFPKLPFRNVVRFGSTWAGDGKARVECNTVAAVRTSANKRLMKQAFDQAGVISALYISSSNNLTEFVTKYGFPIVAKHVFGSRGTGNYLLTSQAQLDTWLAGKTLSHYIFEKFYDYSREYRLHVTADGCFYTCRKVLRNNVPQANRWFRNDSNSNWIIETNPLFDKPVNWDKIVAESVKALKAVGLDIGAIDVRVQSAHNKEGALRPDPKFIILETNSAPSFGKITTEKYVEMVPKILKAKKLAL